MDLTTIKFISGIGFILLAIVGRIEVKDIKIGTESNYLRIFSFIIGLLLLLFNPNNQNFSNNSRDIKITEWEGNWSIGWGYSKNFNNPQYLNMAMNFRIENDKLIGSYESNFGKKIVKTTLIFDEFDGRRISGKYKGYYRDNSVYESGNIELFLVENGDFFIGRYLRTMPNSMEVDGNYRLWHGTKIQE